MRRLSLFCTLAAAIGLMCTTLGAAWIQQAPTDKDLKSRVAELVKQLDAGKAADRQKAQDELVNIGAPGIPFLPAANAEGLSAEQNRRLAEIRKSLGGIAARLNVSSSLVSLSNKSITLSDAIAEIQRQTKNQLVDMREEFGQPVTNPEFALDWKDKSFWEAMDELTTKASTGYYLDTGDRQIGIVGQKMGEGPVTYAGPVRLTVNQIVRRLQFENNTKECVVQLDIAWEPRLRPILFEMKPDELEVVDDQDRKIAADAGMKRPGVEDDEQRGMRVPIDSQMLHTLFVVRLNQPEKSAEKIKSLGGKLHVVVPTDIQSFEYGELAKAKDSKQQRGGVTVTLESFKDLEDGLWAADMLLQFDAKGEAFESYETWFYDNEAYLQKPDGTRFFLNGGTTLTENSEGRVGIQYRFVDAPGKMSDYKLIYRTPSRIARDFVPFQFKDLDLP